MKYGDDVYSKIDPRFISSDFSTKGYLFFRHEPKKEHITGEALIAIKNLIKELDKWFMANPQREKQMF